MGNSIIRHRLGDYPEILELFTVMTSSVPQDLLEFKTRIGRRISSDEREYIEYRGYKWCKFIKCVVNGSSDMSVDGLYSLLGRDISKIIGKDSRRLSNNIATLRDFIFNECEDIDIYKWNLAKDGVPEKWRFISPSTKNIYTKFTDYVESCGFCWCTNLGVVSSKIEFSRCKSIRQSKLGHELYSKMYSTKNSVKKNINSKKYYYSDKGRLKYRETYDTYWFQFKKQLRSNIARINKGGNKTNQILGCSFDEALDELRNRDLSKSEIKHIDHIVPLSWAKNEQEAIELCNISNLQYLSSEENLHKSDNIHPKFFTKDVLEKYSHIIYRHIVYSNKSLLD